MEQAALPFRGDRVVARHAIVGVMALPSWLRSWREEIVRRMTRRNRIVSAVVSSMTRSDAGALGRTT